MGDSEREKMKGWVCGWVSGYTGGWWVNVWMDRYVYDHIGGKKMDKWAPGLVGRWEDGKVNEYKNDSMDG